MSVSELAQLFELLAPRFTSVALCALRLLPIALLCPLFGGMHTPTSVRLGLVLSLALSLHLAGGVTVAAPVDLLAFGQLAFREAAFGISLGLLSSLPFDAARLGGRFIDLSRGTSAEAVLPQSGTRESASGEGLYQLMVALAVTGPAFGLVLSAVWRSFGLVPLGGFVAGEAQAFQLGHLAGAAMATGLAIGAPIAGACLAIDLLLGLISRATPQAGFQELSAPLRIVGGGAILWLGLGVLAQRLLADLLQVDGAIAAVVALQNG